MKKCKFFKIFVCLILFIVLIFGILNVGFGMFKKTSESSDNYLVSYTGDNVTFSHTSGSLVYGSTTTVKITPAIGYYLTSFTCTNGYTTDALVGDKSIVTQTVTINNNGIDDDSTCTANVSKRLFKINVNEKLYGDIIKTEVFDVEYGESFIYNYKAYGEGNYLSKVECSNGYSYSKIKTSSDDLLSYKNQNIIIYNNKVLENTICDVYTDDNMRLYIEVIDESGGMVSSIVDNEELRSSKIQTKVRYGQTTNFIVQPQNGYYLKDIICKLSSNDKVIDSNNYILSSYSIDVGEKKSRNNQTISITNNYYRGDVYCSVVFKKYEVVELSVNSGAKLNSQYTKMKLYLDDNSDSFVLSPDDGYYLKSISCSKGYKVSEYNTGSGIQKIEVTSLGSSDIGSCKIDMSNNYNIEFYTKNGESMFDNNLVTLVNLPFGNKIKIVFKT